MSEFILFESPAKIHFLTPASFDKVVYEFTCQRKRGSNDPFVVREIAARTPLRMVTSTFRIWNTFWIESAKMEILLFRKDSQVSFYGLYLKLRVADLCVLRYLLVERVPWFIHSTLAIFVLISCFAAEKQFAE